jgi:parallel beta-helix repeat protein
MGQTNTEKAALRFDNSSRSLTDAHSSVTNCVIHDSGAWGIYVHFSSNIDVSNTDVWSPKQVGVVIDIVTNVHFDSVNVYNVI